MLSSLVSRILLPGGLYGEKLIRLVRTDSVFLPSSSAAFRHPTPVRANLPSLLHISLLRTQSATQVGHADDHE